MPESGSRFLPFSQFSTDVNAGKGSYLVSQRGAQDQVNFCQTDCLPVSAEALFSD
ncbi:Uncharacterised protein [Yokenella regensburgei]|nr:Uncharacterised protein [Yokenella regensburgei]